MLEVRKLSSSFRRPFLVDDVPEDGKLSYSHVANWCYGEVIKVPLGPVSRWYFTQRNDAEWFVNERERLGV